MDAQVLPSLHAELETLQTVRDLLQERLSLTFLTSGGKSLTSFEQAEPGNWIVSIQTTQMHSLTFLFKFFFPLRMAHRRLAHHCVSDNASAHTWTERYVSLIGRGY
jgi:hypothetical protein